VLSFVRSGEIRGAKWDEINWEKAQWKIPAERMKVKEIHIVPLAKQSIEILKQIRRISGHSLSGYIFPSQNDPRKTMSENTFLRVIEVMGYKGKTTGHGFRSTASTILNENGFRRDVIERQLAHAERDTVRAAYNHAEYLKERTEMMQWWADYVSEVTKGGKVLAGRFRGTVAN
jgi:integrase